MNTTVRVPILKTPDNVDLPYPEHATPGSSGVDLLAAVVAPVTLRQGQIAMVPTGISIAVPPGYEAQVRARSGLAMRHGITIVNGPGTIDSDYRGEIGVILTTLKDEPFVIERGMRIAQLVLCPVARFEFVPVERLDATDRGAGGFGHTGVAANSA